MDQRSFSMGLSESNPNRCQVDPLEACRSLADEQTLKKLAKEQVTVEAKRGAFLGAP